MLDMKDMRLKFGRFLRNHREDQGLTQEAVAEQLGIAQAQYSRIERGLRPVDFPMAWVICEIINVEPEKFMREYREYIKSLK